MRDVKRHLSCLARAGLGGLVVSLCGAGSAAACIDVAGEAIEGGLIWGRVPPGSAVRLDDEMLPVLPDGHFFAGFHRDAPERAVLRVGEECELPIRIEQREYRISRVEGVPQRTVTPPEEQLERIRRER